jgi:sterol desaturase/sphingolipid hydroxylase (fatty acid hydroxylase superfamily)
MSKIDLSQPTQAMTWRNIVLRMINLVHCSAEERSEACVRRTERLEIYNRNYGLHLALAAAFSLLFLVMVVVSILQFCVPAWRMAWHCNPWILGWAKSPIVLVALAFAAYVAYDRMSYFDLLYARELFLVFLSLPEPPPVL